MPVPAAAPSSAPLPQGHEHKYGFKLATLFPRTQLQPRSGMLIRDVDGLVPSANLVAEGIKFSSAVEAEDSDYEEED